MVNSAVNKTNIIPSKLCKKPHIEKTIIVKINIANFLLSEETNR
jgi:hypothetical protein